MNVGVHHEHAVQDMRVVYPNGAVYSDLHLYTPSIGCKGITSPLKHLHCLEINATEIKYDTSQTQSICLSFAGLCCMHSMSVINDTVCPMIMAFVLLINGWLLQTK